MAKEGLVKGLSYKHDFAKDIDNLYRREAYAARIRSEKEQKARYYAEKLKEGQAVTPYNQARLEGFYKDLNNDLADFVISNPNFETDVGKMQEFNSIADQYINNDILREDMQVKQEFDVLRQKAAQGDMYEHEIEREMDRYETYANQDPGSEEKMDPYVFVNAQHMNMFDVMKEGNSFIQERFEISEQMGIRTENTKFLDGAFQDTAAVLYHDQEMRPAIDKAFNQYGNKISETPTEWLSDMLRYGEKMREAYLDNSENYASIIANRGRNQGGDPIAMDFFSNLVNKIGYKTTNADGQAVNMDNPIWTSTGIETLALTQFNDKGGVVSVQGDNSSIKVFSRKEVEGDNGEGTGKYQKQNELANLNIDASIVARNSSRILSFGGMTYAEVGVTVMPNLDDPSLTGTEAAISPEQIEQLEKAGFKKSTFTRQGVMDMSISQDVSKEEEWTGKVYVPVNVTEESKRNYNDQFLGQSELNTVNPSVRGSYMSLRGQPETLANAIYEKTGYVPMPPTEATKINGKKVPDNFYIIDKNHVFDLEKGEVVRLKPGMTITGIED